MPEVLGNPDSQEEIKERFFNHTFEDAEYRICNYYGLGDLTDRELLILRQEVREAIKNSEDYVSYIRSFDVDYINSNKLGDQAPIPYLDAVYGWFEHYLGIDVLHTLPMESPAELAGEKLKDFNRYLQLVFEKRRAESETSGIINDDNG